MEPSNFISVERSYSIVKEEMKSYFSTGAVDDSLFEVWTEFAIKPFQGSSMPVISCVLPIKNFMVVLPQGFNSVKSLWACGLTHSVSVANPSSTYYQTDCRVTPIDNFNRCDGCPPEEDKAYCGTNPKYRATNKITGSTLFEYWASHLLKPSDRKTYDCLGNLSPNMDSCSTDTFSIVGNKIQVSMPSGYIHMDYYSTNKDEDGMFMIPDNVRVEEYLMKYLKFKVLEVLFNSATDETFNQLERKLANAELDKNIAFIAAEVSLKKKTKYGIAKLINQRRNRHSYYRRSLS